MNALVVDETHVYSVSDDGSLRSYRKSKWSDTTVIQFDVGVIKAISADAKTIFIGGADMSVKAIPKDIFTGNK